MIIMVVVRGTGFSAAILWGPMLGHTDNKSAAIPGEAIIAEFRSVLLCRNPVWNLYGVV